jgi:hypothetical protein
MATEEKKKDDEEKKEEEIMESPGLRWRVSLSIIVSIGWLVFLILWFAFYASDYTVYQNIAIILVSILIMGAILGVSWVSWGIKYCWKGETTKKEKERGWWQLKRIWGGFCVIVLLIAFGIAQPILWRLLAHANPPGGVISLSTLLTIVVALFSLGLTGFSVLIYEYLKERLTIRITQNLKSAVDELTQNLKSAEDEVHMHIKEHENEFRRKEEELSKRAEEEVKNRQNLFTAKVQRSMGYIFWRLFKVEEEKKEGKNASVLKALIELAIDRAETSLDFAKKLPEKEYKNDRDRCGSNLVYFLADAARIGGVELTKEDKERALILSNELFEKISKEDCPDYYEFQENCAWALQHLSEKKDEVSKQKAGNIICEFLKDESIPYSRREEIKEKWAPFLEEIEKKSNTANL